MLSENLITELQKLSHAEKLRLVQMLVNQLAQEENIFTSTEYEVWSPYDAPGAAAILTQMLEENPQ
jgi:hypothetical protein